MAMFFDESCQFKQTWLRVEGHQSNIPAKQYWNWSGGFWQEEF